ncbi:hypothetical protein HYV64_00395 [Candidatus Shapirobacteria bacterium]|nr:hypothetical protein [Candidatus Shapirobacteria bacterium]
MDKQQIVAAENALEKINATLRNAKNIHVASNSEEGRSASYDVVVIPVTASPSLAELYVKKGDRVTFMGAYLGEKGDDGWCVNSAIKSVQNESVTIRISKTGTVMAPRL